MSFVAFQLSAPLALPVWVVNKELNYSRTLHDADNANSSPYFAVLRIISWLLWRVGKDQCRCAFVFLYMRFFTNKFIFVNILLNPILLT